MATFLDVLWFFAAILGLLYFMFFIIQENGFAPVSMVLAVCASPFLLAWSALRAIHDRIYWNL